MFRRVYRISVSLEVILFPWINGSESLEKAFYLLFALNIATGLCIRLIAKDRVQVKALDIWVASFVIISLLNPYTYWHELSLEAPYIRMLVFFLRYMLLDKSLLSNNYTLMIGIILSSIFSIIGWMNGLGDPWRLNYPYGDANYQGFIFGTYVLFSVMIMGSGNRYLRYLSLGSMLMSLIVLILSASRGSILTALLVLLIYILFYATFRIKLIATSLSIASISFLLTSSLFSDLSVVQRFVNPRASDNGAALSRFQEVEQAFGFMKEHPETIIFGSGLSSSASEEVAYGHKFRIHNTTVSSFFDSGIIGGITLLALWTTILKNGYKNQTIYLALFIVINSQTFYVFTFYHFFICLRLISTKVISM